MSKLHTISNFKSEFQNNQEMIDSRKRNSAIEMRDYPIASDSRLVRNPGLFQRFKSAYHQFIVSHVFLGMMVSIILFAPKKLLQVKRVSSSYLFVKKVLKRGFDILGAIFGLMVSSLLFLLLPILIRLDSQGEIIFKQRRIGLNRRKRDRRVVNLEVPFERRKAARRKEDLLGQPFVLYKFRSMKNDAEKKTGPVWASENDPRVTNLGKVLRPLHIDELPQFVNVLMGEMSLVGPRPERPEFVKELKKQVQDYEKRFDGKPGITGLAQLECGYDTSVEDVYKKVRFDLEYIKNLQIRRDVRILWNTLMKILGRSKPANEHNGPGAVPTNVHHDNNTAT